MSATKPSREIVDAGDRRAEVIQVLRHYLARAKAGELFTGLLLVLEQQDGGYVTAQTGTDNVAERLGRIELLKHDVIALAVEDEPALGVRVHVAADDPDRWMREMDERKSGPR